MEGVAELLADRPELVDFFGSPVVDDAARAQVIEKVFRGRASDLLTDALQVIHRKGRLGALPAIAEAYRREHRERRGLVEATVRTAVPLPPALRERLVAEVGRLSGKTGELLERVDPGILGGLVVEFAGEKIDASIASRLSGLGKALFARASEEIHSGKAYIVE
jgi:ATP synthase F1 delta subunit